MRAWDLLSRHLTKLFPSSQFQSHAGDALNQFGGRNCSIKRPKLDQNVKATNTHIPDWMGFNQLECDAWEGWDEEFFLKWEWRHACAKPLCTNSSTFATSASVVQHIGRKDSKSLPQNWNLNPNTEKHPHNIQLSGDSAKTANPF